MFVKQKLIEKFGLSKQKELKSLDKHNLFVQGGISVIAALAGEGKTTLMLKYMREWEQKGYSVSYINFDSALHDNQEIIESPTNADEINKMFQIIEEYATENDIIVIDSLKSAASFGSFVIENNEDMYMLMLEFRTIIKKTNCSIVLVHHIWR